MLSRGAAVVNFDAMTPLNFGVDWVWSDDPEKSFIKWAQVCLNFIKFIQAQLVVIWFQEAQVFNIKLGLLVLNLNILRKINPESGNKKTRRKSNIEKLTMKPENYWLLLRPEFKQGIMDQRVDVWGVAENLHFKHIHKDKKINFKTKIFHITLKEYADHASC